MYNDEEYGNVNGNEENSSYGTGQGGEEGINAAGAEQEPVEPSGNPDSQPNFTFRESEEAAGAAETEPQAGEPVSNAAENLFAQEAQMEAEQGTQAQDSFSGTDGQKDFASGEYSYSGKNIYDNQNRYDSGNNYGSQGSYGSNNYGSQGGYGSNNNYGSQGGYGSNNNYGSQGGYGSNNNYGSQGGYGSNNNYGSQGSYGSDGNYGSQSGSGSDNYGDQSGYGSRNNYNSYDDQDISRWQPDQDKYNSYDPNKVVTVKKSGKRWWLPVVIILAVLVVAIGIIAAILFVKLDQSVNTVEDTTVQEIETVESAESSGSSSSSGIILTDVSDVVESVMPSVVSITSRTIVESGGYSSIWGYFYGYGSSSSESEEVESGIGSGTIVGQNDTELLILTSYHVVEGCSSLYVTFDDDNSVDGYIKSYAEDVDIAVVAVLLEDISSETLSAIKIASLCTEEVEVGEGIIVIGDALGYGQSVVTGIISATGREITVDDTTITVLQTDAAINSGNSGGCMLNSNGEIVGISEAKIQDTSVEGMCYAIPIYDNYDLIQSLLTAETTTDTDSDSSDSSDTDSDDLDSNSGFGGIFGNDDTETETIPGSTEDETSSSSSTSGAYLGIYGRDIDSDLASSYGLAEGVYVADVTSGGGAEAAGIQSGDIIIGADGQDLTTMTELQAVLAEHSAGDTIEIVVLRLQDSEYVEMTFEVTLTESLE